MRLGLLHNGTLEDARYKHFFVCCARRTEEKKWGAVCVCKKMAFGFDHEYDDILARLQMKMRTIFAISNRNVFAVHIMRNFLI